MSKKIFFNHIPKTRGTTIHEVVARGFAESEIAHDPISAEDLMLAPYDVLSHYRFVSGHYGHYLSDFLVGEYFNVVSFINPWRRFISFLKHSYRCGDFGQSLDGVFTNQWRTNKNLLKKDFVNTYWRSSYVSYLQPTESFLQRTDFVPTENDLKSALDILKTYDSIIVEDNFYESLNYLSLAVGMPPYEKAPHFNMSPATNLKIPNVEERFKETFIYEYMLYDEARKISRHKDEQFKRQYGTNFSDFNECYLNFENRLSDNVFNIDWSKSIRCNGWSERAVPSLERFSKCTARLMSEPIAIVDASIRDGKKNISGRFVFWASTSDVQDNIKIRVNGKDVVTKIKFPLLHSYGDNDTFILLCQIENDASTNEFRLEFILEKSILDRSEVWLMLGELH